MSNICIPIEDIDNEIIKYNKLVKESAHNRTEKGKIDFCKYAALSTQLSLLKHKYKTKK
jgi:hypothetical protein